MTRLVRGASIAGIVGVATHLVISFAEFFIPGVSNFVVLLATAACVVGSGLLLLLSSLLVRSRRREALLAFFALAMAATIAVGVQGRVRWLGARTYLEIRRSVIDDLADRLVRDASQASSGEPWAINPLTVDSPSLQPASRAVAEAGCLRAEVTPGWVALVRSGYVPGVKVGFLFSNDKRERLAVGDYLFGKEITLVESLDDDWALFLTR